MTFPYTVDATSWEERRVRHLSPAMVPGGEVSPDGSCCPGGEAGRNTKLDLRAAKGIFSYEEPQLGIRD